MVQDNRGFAAVVSAVDRLRDTTGSIGARQLGVGKARYGQQVEQSEILSKILAEVTGISALLGQKLPAQPQGQKAIRFNYDGAERNVTGYRIEKSGVIKGYEANSGRIQSFAPEKMEDRQDYVVPRSERQRAINEAIAREQKFYARLAGQSTNDGFNEGLKNESPGKQFGDAFVTDLKTSLEIASPSRKAKALAKNFVEGWALGLDEMPTVTDKAIAKSSRKGKATGLTSDALREALIDTLFVNAKSVFISGGKEPLTAQAIAAALSKTTLKTESKTSLMESFKRGFFEYGVFANLGASVGKGFQQGIKERSGWDAQTVGAAVGRAAGNPGQSAKETVSWRRKLELDSSLAAAQKQAESETVSQSDKPKIFTVGGIVGKRGRGGGYVSRELKNIVGDEAEVEAVRYPETDISNPGKGDWAKLTRLFKQADRSIQNKLIRGSNPDAIALAAKVIAAKKQSPDAPIALYGHSGGSSVVEEAIAILEKGGYTGVQGIGSGDIESEVGYSTKGYRPLLGDKDAVGLSLGKFFGAKPTVKNFKGFSTLDSHDFPEYTRNPEFIKSSPRELQPKLVEGILNQHYSRVVQGSIDAGQRNMAMLPNLPEFEPVRQGFQQIQDNFIKGFVEEAQSFAKEFDGIFSGDEIQAINAVLEKYNEAVSSPDSKKFQLTAKIAESNVTPSKLSVDNPFADLTKAISALIKSVDALRNSLSGTATNPNSLASKYRDRLNSISERAKATAQDKIATMIPNFEGMDIASRRDRVRAFVDERFKAKVNVFRNELKANNPLAMGTGESLLEEIETLRKAIHDFAEHPSSASPNVRKQITGLKSYLTTVEGEIKGLPTQSGKQRRGLPSMVASAEGMAASGDNAAQSLIDAVTARFADGKKAGEGLADATLEGVDRAFDSHSPSKEMIKRGEQAGEGLRIGLENSLDAAKDAAITKVEKLLADVKNLLKQDVDYLQLVKSGDRKSAQKMVDDEADRSGYRVKAYHGTAQKFNEFREGITYFASKKSLARDYAKDAEENAYYEDEKARVINARLKMAKPLSVDGADGSIDFGYDWDVTERAKKEGYDSVEFKNIQDNINPDKNTKRTTTYVTFEPNQVKSADAIVRNDNKKVVPLSKRFDSTVADIRGNLNPVAPDAITKKLDAAIKVAKESGNKAAIEFVEAMTTQINQAFSADDIDLASVLTNVVEGLTKGINETLKDVKQSGKKIGEALQEGTEESLKIESPSKVYQAIGKQIIAGLESGLEGFEGTLEEKQKLLETYVKSVIEMVYDSKKVIGNPTTELQRVRKLFQDIGATGKATPSQLDKAKRFFPGVEVMPEDKPGVAVYQVKKNKIQVKPGREEDQLFQDLIHEYTHALQSHFGAGSKLARLPGDFLRWQGVSTKRGKPNLDDERVARGADRSADQFVQQFGITPNQGRRYETAYHHIFRAEQEAYSNELGIGQEKKRRGFFKADADKIAAQVREAKEQAKQSIQETVEEIKQQIPILETAGESIGSEFARGVEQGQKQVLGRFESFLNWLEGVPIIGTLVKWGRQAANAIASFFRPKEQPPVAQPTKQQKQATPKPVATTKPIQRSDYSLWDAPAQAPPVPMGGNDYSTWGDEPVPTPKPVTAIVKPVAETVKPVQSPQPSAIQTAIAGLNPKKQAERYLNNLSQWIQDIGSGVESAITQEIKQLKASGGNVAQAIRQQIEAVDIGREEKVRQFREAIANGNEEVSQALGQELLEQTEQLRVLFKKMSENVRFFEGRGLWRDQAAEMKRLQTEVLQGQPKMKGRAAKGLTQLISGPTIDVEARPVEEPKQERTEQTQTVQPVTPKPAQNAVLGTVKNALDPKKLADKYVTYLNQWVKTIGGDFEALLNSEFKALNASVKGIVQQKENIVKSLQGRIESTEAGLEDRKAEFRKAIEEGNAEIAKAVGTQLLEQSERLRVLYKAMSQNVKLADDPGSWRNKSGEQTKLQAEVMRGYPNLKGRAKTGVWQSIGSNISASFADSIQAELKTAEKSGYDLGDAAIAGAKKSLKISSPSKVFQQLADWCTVAFVSKFESAIAEGQQVGSEFGNSVSEGVENALGNVPELADNAKQKLGQLFGELKTKFPIIGAILDNLKAAKTFIVGFFVGNLIENALGGIIDAVIQFGNASVDTVLKFESISLAFRSSASSSKEAAKNLKLAADVADELGISLDSAREAWSKMVTTTRGTALEGSQAETLFKVFSETASIRGLTNEEQGQFSKAVSDVLGKGRLQAEEVTGQFGEISALNFRNTLSRALGIQPNQLAQALSSGTLAADDVLPKIAAQYAAENAAIADSTETTQKSINRYNNAIQKLREGFAGWVAGMRPVYEVGAKLINWLLEAIPVLVKAVSVLSIALGVGMVDNLLKAIEVGGGFIAVLGKAKGSVGALVEWVLKLLGIVARPTLAAFGKALLGMAKDFIIVQLAMDAFFAAVDTTKDRFADLTEGNEKVTKSLKAMEAAYRDLGTTAKGTKVDLPTNERDIKSDQTWKPLGLDTGWNLEPVRQMFGLKTLGAKQVEDFVIGNSDAALNADKVLANANEINTVKKIQALDKQIDISRSRQFNNLPGDRQAYKLSIDEQQKLGKERDKLLRITSNYQQGLDGSIENFKARLTALDDLVARKGITASDEKIQRALLTERLDSLEKTKIAFEELTSSLTQGINKLERAVRNITERGVAFREQLERATQTNQAGIYQKALTNGQGTQAVSLQVEQSNNQQLQGNLGNNQNQIAQLSRLLQNQQFAPILAELQRQAKEQGLTLESSGTLERLASEQRKGDELAVIKTLQQILTLKTEVAQQKNQLAQAIYQGRQSIFDLSKSIKDYFINLQDQIKQARIELDKQIQQLKSAQVKQILQRALVPGANSFVNEIVSGLQGVLDQASQIAEQVLGQQSAQFSFEGDRRSLQSELLNFTRGLNGANDALKQFSDWLSKAQNAPSQPSQPVQTQPSQAPHGQPAQPQPTQSSVNPNQRVFPVQRGSIGTSPGQRFGASRDGGKRRHAGIDINASQGEPVYAIVGGTITEIKAWDAKVGSHGIKIAGADGNTWRYGHVVPVSGLAVGQVVDTGSQIAQISQRDRLSSGPHLHLEAGNRDGKFNPSGLLANLPRPKNFKPQTTLVSNRSQPQKTQSSGSQLKPFTLSPEDNALLVRVALAEAEGESLLGKALVIRSILNRQAAIIKGGVSPSEFNAKSGNLRDIVYAPRQYEGVTGPYPRINKKYNSTQLIEANEAVQLALSTDKLIQTLQGAIPDLNRRVTLASATGFRTGDAFFDRSQSYDRVRFGGHIFNTDKNTANRNMRVLFDRAFPMETKTIPSTVANASTQSKSYPSPAPLAYGPMPSMPEAPSRVSNELAKNATAATNELIKIKEGQLKQGDARVLQSISEFGDATANYLSVTDRQLRDAKEQATRATKDLEGQFRDLNESFATPTAKTEREKAKRSAIKQFKEFDYQLLQRQRELTDALLGIDKFLQQAPLAIRKLSEDAAKLQKAGNFQEAQAKLSAVKTIGDTASRIQATRPDYQRALSETIALRGQIQSSQKEALKFVDSQAEIKALEAELTYLDKRGQIAQQKNDWEAERQANLAKITKQLELDTTNTRAQFADDPTALKKQLEIINEKAKLDAEAVNDTYRDRLLQLRQELVGQAGEVAQLQNDLDAQLNANLDKIETDRQSALDAAATKYRYQEETLKQQTDLINQKAELQKKAEQSTFRERSLQLELEEIQLRLNVAQQRSNLQEVERLKLLESETQYQLDLLSIQQKLQAEPEKLAERQRLLNEQLQENQRLIKLDTESGQLNREKSTADLQSQLTQAQIEKMNRLGLEPDSRPLVVADQLAQEQMRFRQQTLDIRRNNPNKEEADAQLAIAAQINQLNIERINSQFKSLGETLLDVGRNNLGTFFENVVGGTKTLSDAFKDMAKSILTTVSQMAAQLATVELFKLFGLSTQGLSGSQLPGIGSLFGGLFGGGGNSGGVGSILSTFASGNAASAFNPSNGFSGILNAAFGFADGGYTGDGHKYQPKGIVHAGEFVLHREATRSIGPDLLAQINNTRSLPTLTLPVETRSSMPPDYGRGGDRSITVNINDKNSRYFTQPQTLARDLVQEMSKA